MTRRGLVQRQCGQIVERPTRQVVGVEQIDTGAAAAGRVEGCQVVGHRLDGKSSSRQQAKILRGFAVEALGDEGRTHQQFIGRLCVELRIFAQEGEERREIARESCLLHGSQHLLVQAGNLGLAKGMNLRRILIERGELQDSRAIVGLAIGQVVGGERGTRAGKIIIAEKRQKLAIGRLNRVANDGDRLFPQGLLVAFRDAGHFLEGRIERDCPPGWRRSRS